MVNAYGKGFYFHCSLKTRVFVQRNERAGGGTLSHRRVLENSKYFLSKIRSRKTSYTLKHLNEPIRNGFVSPTTIAENKFRIPGEGLNFCLTVLQTYTVLNKNWLSTKYKSLFLQNNQLYIHIRLRKIHPNYIIKCYNINKRLFYESNKMVKFVFVFFFVYWMEKLFKTFSRTTLIFQWETQKSWTD